MTSKVLCSVCNKGKGTFQCEGCRKIFCPKHSIDHRHDLSKQLEEIELEHDLAYKTLIQQTQNLRQHSLIQKIDRWEQQSIEKIRQIAEESRNQLLKNITEQNNDIKQKLQDLADELRQGREDNDFLEDDLQQWINKLEAFKSELVNPLNLNIEEDSTSLVNRIHINYPETTQTNLINPSLQEHTQLLIKENSDLRGQIEYETGNHTVRFQMEQLRQNGWIAFGILSSSDQIQKNFHTASTSFGWSNQNQIYIEGELTNEETMDIIQNDTVELTIDCEQQKIHLKNERSNRTIELSIDINKCPFPWQYYTSLGDADTHVRVLNLSD